MGITRGTIKLIAMTVGQEQGGRNVITFGVQGAQSSYPEARASIRESGLTPDLLADEEVIHDEITQFGKTIHQTTLFRLLGYKTVGSLDYYPDEHPTYVENLNRPIPQKLQRKYSLVYDGGMMEHCFNPPQVMMNAVALVKAGGMVIHHVPMNNWVDHGFYQFFPTLFFDFYDANGFTDLEMKVHFMERHKESFIRYNPRTDDPLPYFLGSKTRAMVFFKARKSADFVDIKFPIQGRYRELFGHANNAETGKARRGIMGRLRRSLQKRTMKLMAATL